MDPEQAYGEESAWVRQVVETDDALTGPAEVVDPADHLPPMVRTPSGRLAPEIPLDAVLPVPITPFHRTSNAEPAPRWVGVFVTVLAVLFVPYIVILALSLPDHATARHYATAWVGLDVMEMAALAVTAWFALRRSTWVSLSATAAATLIVCDAWFDVVTSRDATRMLVALAEALVVELPLAGFCVWIARHAEVVHERATLLLLRRSARQAERLRELEGQVGDSP